MEQTVIQKFSQVAKLQSGHVLGRWIPPVLKSDIIIGQNSSMNDVFWKAEVIKVAKDVTFCEVGDTIFASWAWGNEWKEGNGEKDPRYKILEEKFIMGVL